MEMRITYPDVNSIDGKVLHGWIGLGNVAEELLIVLVPFDRIESIRFQLKGTMKRGGVSNLFH